MIRMAIQVVLIDEAEDRRDVHEIARIDRAGLCAEALGLSLAEGKEISGGIQRVLAGAQVAKWQEAQRTCPDCGRRRSLKGRHPILFRTPFGTLRLSSERVRSCLCAEKPKKRVPQPAGGVAERTRQPGTAVSRDEVRVAGHYPPWIHESAFQQS
jgi:DNA-directed RNA polymerase subunit RPC12/RpoP